MSESGFLVIKTSVLGRNRGERKVKMGGGLGRRSHKKYISCYSIYICTICSILYLSDVSMARSTKKYSEYIVETMDDYGSPSHLYTSHFGKVPYVLAYT